MRRIAVMNQKGGVGKTTTALNLAHALALSGRRVAALDMDPQGHLGKGLGLGGEAEQGLDEVLLDGVPLEERPGRSCGEGSGSRGARHGRRSASLD